MRFRIIFLSSKKNPTYKEFLELLHIDISQIKSIQEIPFLPIDFFKTRIIKTSEWETEKYFYLAERAR